MKQAKIVALMLLLAVPLTAQARQCVDVSLGCSDVLEAQRLLLQQGYDAGVADGRTGPRTCTAANSFWQDAGMGAQSGVSSELISTIKDRTDVRANASNVTNTLAWEVQQNLLGAGFQAGKLDGRPGKQTVQAIRKYQKLAGLPVDGKVTKELLDHLSFSQPKIYASRKFCK